MKTFLVKLGVVVRTILVTIAIMAFIFLFNFGMVVLAVAFAHYLAVPLLLKMGVPLEISWLAVMLTFIRIHFARLTESDIKQRQMLKRLILSDMIEVIQNEMEGPVNNEGK